MKLIRIGSCQACPFFGTCFAWTNLARANLSDQQKVAANMRNSTSVNFILEGCDLEDDQVAIRVNEPEILDGLSAITPK